MVLPDCSVWAFPSPRQSTALAIYVAKPNGQLPGFRFQLPLVEQHGTSTLTFTICDIDYLRLSHRRTTAAK